MRPPPKSKAPSAPMPAPKLAPSRNANMAPSMALPMPPPMTPAPVPVPKMGETVILKGAKNGVTSQHIPKMTGSGPIPQPITQVHGTQPVFASPAPKGKGKRP